MRLGIRTGNASSFKLQLWAAIACALLTCSECLMCYTCVFRPERPGTPSACRNIKRTVAGCVTKCHVFQGYDKQRKPVIIHECWGSNEGPCETGTITTKNGFNGSNKCCDSDLCNQGITFRPPAGLICSLSALVIFTFLS